MSAPLEPTLELYANPLARYFAATRPAFLTASLMAGIVGLAAAWHGAEGLDPGLAAATLLFAVLAHAGANVLNDYYDALNGTDARNTQRIFPFTGGSRFIQNGVLTEVQTRNFGFMLMVCVAAAGLWLMAHSTPQLMYVGLAGLFIGWAYSAPPFRLNSRGLGELCIAASFLAIVVGADMVQRAAFDWLPVIAGMPYAFLVADLLYINQFPDRAADSAAGKLHWVARLEVRQARWGYLLIALSAYAWLLAAVAAGVLPLWALLGLLSLPLSFEAAHQLMQYAHRPQQLAGAIKLTIAAAMVHGAMLSAGLILG